MKRFISRFPAVIAAAALIAVFCYGPAAWAAPLKITVTIPDKGASIRACAQALVDTSGMLKAQGLDAEVRILTESQGEAPDDEVSINMDPRRDVLELISIPFVFRDAAHFQAYLQSDLHREIGARVFRDRIGLAYGGFIQMFSRNVAVTEPKHLYKRWIGGNAEAWTTYIEFNGLRTNSSIIALLSTEYFPLQESRQMGSGDPSIHMVDALLTSAIESELHQSARFVNLVSSAVVPIHMEMNGPSDRWEPNKLKLKVWAEEASLKCSRENYQTELDVLAQLKAAGLQIVPFNRTPMIETSIRLALQKEHAHWTIGEFDRLMQLGGGTKGVPLPSAIVDKMPAAKKKQALAYNAEPTRIRNREIKEIQQQSQSQRLAAIVETSRLSFAASLDSMPMPASASGPADATIAPSSPVHGKTKALLAQLEEAAKACPGDCEAAIKGWAGAAKVYSSLGEPEAARAALTKAFDHPAGKQRPEYLYTAIRVAIAHKHPNARTYAENYVAAVPTIEALKKGNSSERAALYAAWDRASYLIKTAVLLVDIGESDRAKQHLAEALALNADADIQFAAAQWHMGDQTAAWITLKNMIKRSNYSPSWPIVARGSAMAPVNDALAEPIFTYFERLAGQLRAAEGQDPPSPAQNWRDISVEMSRIAIRIGRRDFVERTLIELREDAQAAKGEYKSENQVKYAKARIETLQELLSKGYSTYKLPYAWARIGAVLAEIEEVSGLSGLEQ